jgi:hypothetical protein
VSFPRNGEVAAAGELFPFASVDVVNPNVVVMELPVGPTKADERRLGRGREGLGSAPGPAWSVRPRKQSRYVHEDVILVSDSDVTCSS